MRFLVAVTPLAAAFAVTVTGPADAATRCARLSAGNRAYRVVVVRGAVSCTTARRVLRPFLANRTQTRGWFCVRGHASQNQVWAAQCGTQAGAIVRAYALRR